MPPETSKHGSAQQGSSALTDSEVLTRAAAALSLPLTPRQIEQLLAYRDTLLKWNKVYNLTAIRNPRDMLEHHLVDCLAVVPPLQRWLQAQQSPGLPAEAADTAQTAVRTARSEETPSGATATSIAATPAATPAAAPVDLVPVAAPAICPIRVLDVGSGGGLPGVVLAIVIPQWQIDCVDTVAKKATFVRQVAAELGLRNLHSLHARAENLPGGPDKASYALIISRAFAALGDFCDWTQHLLARGGTWVAMKGQVPEPEIQDLPPDIEVFHVEQLLIPGLSVQRCLVWMRPRAETGPDLGATT